MSLAGGLRVPSRVKATCSGACPAPQQRKDYWVVFVQLWHNQATSALTEEPAEHAVAPYALQHVC